MIILSLLGLALLPFPFVYLIVRYTPWYVSVLSIPFWMAYYTALTWIVMFFILGFLVTS